MEGFRSVSWMWVCVCGASLLSVPDRNITAARFLSCSSKILNTFFWNIPLSLTYLKNCNQRRSWKAGVVDMASLDAASNTWIPRFSLSFTPTFITPQLPLLPLLSLTPKYLFSSLRSTCSDFWKADIYSLFPETSEFTEIYINWLCQWDVSSCFWASNVYFNASSSMSTRLSYISFKIPLTLSCSVISVAFYNFNKANNSVSSPGFSCITEITCNRTIFSLNLHKYN